MNDNPDMHRRQSIRLKGYDYSQAGAYFVTICVYNKKCLFGDVVEGKMCANVVGEMVMRMWEDLPNHYGNVALDEFIVMPNHVHGIIIIQSDVVGAIHELPMTSATNYVGAIHELPMPLPQRNESSIVDIKYRRQMVLPKIIGRFKMNSAKQINKIDNTRGVPVWQRNYYEHIIRNDDELNRIRNYIVNNPAQWAEDQENNS